MDWSGIITAISGMQPGMEAAIHEEVKKSAIIIRDKAVLKFGTYQPAVGPYPAWEQLAPRTVKQKAKAGASGDDPLIGHYPAGIKNKVWPAHLRNTIEFKVEGMSAVVGTSDPLGPWQEFGTSTIPPRPFLFPAAFEEEPDFQKRIKEAVIKGALASWL